MVCLLLIRLNGLKWERVDMPDRVFFGYHIERDTWKAEKIRDVWATQTDKEISGFWDAASWEKIKRKGELAVREWVGKQLEKTSVTVVLIAAETSSRQYVHYAISQSLKRNNGVVGIYIHNIRDRNGIRGRKGGDPFVHLGQENLKIYDWENDNGKKNLISWVEDAHKGAASAG